MSRPDSGPASAGSAATRTQFDDALEPAFGAIAAEFGLIAGDSARVDRACAVIRSHRPSWADPEAVARFRQLAATAKRAPRALTPTCLSLLHDAAAASANPWPILAPLVSSPEPLVHVPSLRCLHDVIASGALALDADVFEELAAAVQDAPDALGAAAALDGIRAAVEAAPSSPLSPAQVSFGSPRPRSRRLAARLLDLAGALPSADFASALLGTDLAGWLAPYFAYTRASHLDLVDLAIGGRDRAELAADLRSAERIAGAPLLRQAIAEIGWKALNAGLETERIDLVTVGDGFPLLLRPAEAALLDGCPGVQRVGERVLFRAFGSDAPADADARSASDMVDRFRACNLRHADVLADLLDVAPLSVDKVNRMCARMDAIVSDFCVLFETHTDECSAIRATYGRIRDQIDRDLAAVPAGQPLPADLTRLVQMFEDPATAADIHTLHGCKRYLHQRGLRLGFRLAEAGRGTNHAVTLAAADGERVLNVTRAIEYVDFEATDAGALPQVVRIGAEAYGHHLLHGERSFPKLKFYCYGNEVHCYATFRNHPAFIRVDFSPPQRGGMIDLEYAGVSKFDLSWHPNPSLTAIETVFRRLDFDIHIADTRIQARYDKERASSLIQLSGKIDELFRLVPALMDLDWIVGDLQISPAARQDVAIAWADFFVQWGLLPMRRVLTTDRLGILAAVRRGPGSDTEVRWTGDEPYRDLFTVPAPAGFWTALRARLEQFGLDRLATLPESGPVAQTSLSTALLRPLRLAVARGELLDTGVSYAVAPASRYRRLHEAGLLAAILDSSDEAVAASARMAHLASLLEGSLTFDPVGTVNGYEVQRATMALPWRTTAICGLRDTGGMLRSALFIDDDAPFERRDADDVPWRPNWTVDAEVLRAVLRRSNYVPPWTDPPADPPGVVATRVREAFARPNTDARPAPLQGERLLVGLKASPGRAVGIARIGLAGRRPDDVGGAIIVESALSPSDNPYVFRGAGIVTTGGGILSHAGLIALQFHKPGVVLGGRIERQPSGARALICTRVTRREVRSRVGPYDVTEYRDVTIHSDRVDDGDLLAVDADAGTVLVLGQQADTLALHDELKRLVAGARSLGATQVDAEVLVQRGALLRARHQIERLLGRIADPVLARHAVMELLIGEAGSDAAVPAADKTRLVAALCANREVAEVARAAVGDLREQLGRRVAAAEAEAYRAIPSATDSLEVLALRLDLLRQRRLLENVDAILGRAGIVPPAGGSTPSEAVETLARSRLQLLRDEEACGLASGPIDQPGVRHALRHVRLLNLVLGDEAEVVGTREPPERRQAAADEARVHRLRDARTLHPSDGGMELRPLVGGKAANLAEAARAVGSGLIPPWFVVADCAFREVLSLPVPGDARHPSLAVLIDRTLSARDGTDTQKAAAIARAWDAMILPEDLEAQVASAYRQLAAAGPIEAADVVPDEDPSEPFVAVRSSAREEDAETDARAGEFDTFLFVRGERALVDHLKRAWSGLWNARAIHNRAVLGTAGDVGGGVLVQRMVWARAAGVLHTINLAGGHWREMLVNAGLGIGEGVVSGAVAADQIVVSKDGLTAGGPLRLRYITNDKRERVVFDRSLGSGTRRVETLYHQRLRPALEYFELCDLVQAAARLEAWFRQPLDIEFALEGPHLRLLQVRPVPAAVAVWRDTAERHPFARRPT